MRVHISDLYMERKSVFGYRERHIISFFIVLFLYPHIHAMRIHIIIIITFRQTIIITVLPIYLLWNQTRYSVTKGNSKEQQIQLNYN